MNFKFKSLKWYKKYGIILVLFYVLFFLTKFISTQSITGKYCLDTAKSDMYQKKTLDDLNCYFEINNDSTILLHNDGNGSLPAINRTGSFLLNPDNSLRVKWGNGDYQVLLFEKGIFTNTIQVGESFYVK
ncbi:MAG TPA: hypothetical protein VK588_06575 [Chitinophagaceae bacterium]|nr:hypothetical protein [Chitinophagaceae bacterium]